MQVRARRAGLVVAALWAAMIAVAALFVWNPWQLALLDRSSLLGQTESVQQTVDSADRTHRIVVTKWAAAIDPGWSVYVEDRRGLLSRRREIWRSVEHVSPASVSFTGPTTVVVTGSNGQSYLVSFDAGSLAPTPFHCLSPGYC